MILSLLGIFILLLTPFPAEVNDSVAFILFDIGWLVTLVRMIVFVVRPNLFLTAFWKNWKTLQNTKLTVRLRLQKACGMSIPIHVGQGRGSSLIFKSLGVEVKDGNISLDDVFTIKNRLPMKDFNRRFPDLISVTRHYAFQLRWLIFSTAGVFILNSAMILLRLLVINATGSTTNL